MKKELEELIKAIPGDILEQYCRSKKLILDDVIFDEDEIYDDYDVITRPSLEWLTFKYLYKVDAEEFSDLVVESFYDKEFEMIYIPNINFGKAHVCFPNMKVEGDFMLPELKISGDLDLEGSEIDGKIREKIVLVNGKWTWFKLSGK